VNGKIDRRAIREHFEREAARPRTAGPAKVRL
jgi:hypothetical protein